jgi:hypothetical protein
MCCASIKYTFKRDRQEFHACASKLGIESSNGEIYDSFGFSGTWFCNSANATMAGMGVTALIVVLI